MSHSIEEFVYGALAVFFKSLFHQGWPIVIEVVLLLCIFYVVLKLICMPSVPLNRQAKLLSNNISHKTLPEDVVQ